MRSLFSVRGRRDRSSLGPFKGGRLGVIFAAGNLRSVFCEFSTGHPGPLTGERERENRGPLPVGEDGIVSNSLCTAGCLPAEHGTLAHEVLEGEEDGDVTGYAEDHV